MSQRKPQLPLLTFFREVRKSDGLKLARAYTTLFGEVSAADGRNVDHCIIELAKLLAERQDFNIQGLKTIKTFYLTAL